MCALCVGPGAARTGFAFAQANFRTMAVSACDAFLFRAYRDAGGPHGSHAALHMLAQPNALCTGSAFLSHSSRDDPDAKAAALCTWAHTPARMAMQVWVDAACIDQLHLERALQCLPIYIYGSTDFLALVGPTFSGRLWCIMEVFFYMQLKRTGHGRLHVLSAGDAQLALKHFAVAEAQCTHAEDRERMLATVEASYGTLAEFDRLMRVFALLV